MHVEAGRAMIAGIAPDNLKRTFFSNSGTEAIETALMMACLATGRSEIIALRVGYHGRSLHGDERHRALAGGGRSRPRWPESSTR